MLYDKREMLVSSTPCVISSRSLSPKSRVSCEPHHLMSKYTVGNSLWHVMHAFSFAYPETPTEQDKHWAIQFYQSIGYLFPCPECRFHYLKMISEELPLTVESRDALSQWCVQVHNRVNTRLGKSVIPYHVVKQWYTTNNAITASMFQDEWLANTPRQHLCETILHPFDSKDNNNKNTILCQPIETLAKSQSSYESNLFVLLFILIIVSLVLLILFVFFAKIQKLSHTGKNSTTAMYPTLHLWPVATSKMTNT